MPSSSHSDSSDPRSWLGYAHADLLLAESAPPSGVYLELLCFHAQQAAEKALKAVLLARTGAPPPQTHDVILLIDLAERAGAGASPLSAEAAQALTQYAVITRYPADLGDVDEAEWQAAVADARAVVEWAAEQVAGRP
ncbi:HEPN domain-containing protein [Rubrivirga litoralis]|uniref:HEPN domain-containing protein n=1 Tax=Rubrivirga litoralis TaxID=3075598 RepID=A0ABU3BSK7_9BACT|nr:HEPN domain-containing protein [Rubrivirga sp. F394]MDT0632151.1 HEPN domain-containing protein [Rubrivirga sp. F394]